MAGIKLKTVRQVIPQCYAYTTPGISYHDGWTKIGFTERDVETRLKEQTHTADIRYKLWWHLRAAYITPPCDVFSDKDFHAYLKKLGVNWREGTEWFQIDPLQAKSDYHDFIENHGVLSAQTEDEAVPYKLRDEQAEAVAQTKAYFQSHRRGEFLWNAKPRFGKTLSAYDLCKQMDAHSILIVTNRPAIANSWYADYERFFGPQSGYLFVSNVDGIQDKKYVLSREKYLEKLDSLDNNDDKIKGFIEFVSLQDLKGALSFGGKHEKLKEVAEMDWDILIIDEAHEGVDTCKTDIAFNKINRKSTLHLSGTPFKALANDKFPEDAIYNWTYADEQQRKRDWDSSKEEENPYENLPRLNLYTYQMSDIVRDKAKKGIELANNDIEEYAFDLNEFFKTKDSGNSDKFVHDADVDKFLDALTTQEKFPFSTPELRNKLKHTFWLLNRVASAKALAKKLKDHPVFKDYEIILAAGDGKLDEETATAKAFDRVKKAIAENDKTITLSVGQLTTGVTIPEWTAVLMLSNMSSPALYMQAAFRAQNPCLFQEGGNTYRKENAYVFDFDPARTLTIFEQFANDLIPATAGEKGDFDQKKHNVRELLNFFPVYGEDDNGAMIELDAESVLTIPRHIHAKEVVERGFMSNFLFANISGIFGAPKEVIDIISGLQAIEEPKKLKDVPIDEHTADALDLNENNEVDIPEEQVIGQEQGIFGEKIYGDVQSQLDEALQNAQDEQKNQRDPEKDMLQHLQEQFSKPITNTLMQKAEEHYGKDMRKSTKKNLERKIQQNTNKVVQEAFGDYSIKQNQLEYERQQKVEEAQNAKASMQDITHLNDEYEQKKQDNYQQLLTDINKTLSDNKTIQENTKTIVKTVETEKKNAQKKSIEGDVRDHLRGFSRTIPAFLMAYGDRNTTLANFDQLVPADVFWEVTVNPQTGKGVSLENFRFLRDGGYYYVRDENGKEIKDEAHKKYYEGHLFDEVVFNDAVQEFMNKREKLANYFEETKQGDIFDYIPPQRTNQIFTPKRVVKDMVNRLEKENPGCFDNPDYTFADLYMKSGMYITEIVTRLFQSKRMKELIPDDAERLNHIFAKQVYGCAPTEIIYRICLRYILGFSDKIKIARHNIKKFDTLEPAQKGDLAEKLKNLFHL